MARYRIARRAATDLDAIWLFIAQDSPASADQFLDRLYHAFVSLAHAPRSAHSVFILPLSCVCSPFVNT